MKVTETTHGQGFTKNLGNYESLRVYNEITVTFEKKDDIKKCHVKLREAAAKLIKQDIERLVEA